MAHEYKTHYVGPPGSGRVFCGIPRGNFPVTVVFETVTCRQCVRRYYSRGNTVTNKFIYHDNLQIPGTVTGRLHRANSGPPIQRFPMTYGDILPKLWPHQRDDLAYLLRAILGDPIDTSASWPPWLPAQDDGA